MTRTLQTGLLAVALVFAGAVSAAPLTAAAARPEEVEFGKFGKLALYRPAGSLRRVALFVSGDGGWNQGVVEMAQALAGLDTLVVGIDIRHYLKRLETSKDKCSYPAGDFEALGQFIEKKLALPQYLNPVLVGYSSGATLVYTVLAQAPPNTFRGAVSLGFCPDLPVTKVFCPGHGLSSTPVAHGKGRVFAPQPKLEPPWVALHGTSDLLCSAEVTRAFVAKINTAQFIALPKVGHGFSVKPRWLPQFEEAFTRLADKKGLATTRENERDVASQGHAHPDGEDAGHAHSAVEVSDLPLIEVSAQGTQSDLFAVLWSGDGGWAGIDRELAQVLSERGIPVVGVDSLKYFWTARTPAQGALDLERMIRHYQTDWKKKRVLVVGYSRGADVLPFFTARLPEDVLDQVAVLALLGPSRKTEFEFHLTDWLGGGEDRGQPLLPEIEKLKGKKILCLYGKNETDTLCTQATASQLTALPFEGGHHFDGNYRALAEAVLKDEPPAAPEK